MLEKKAMYAIDKYHLIEKGDALLVGVSGGPDSLALLHFLHSIQEKYQLKLIVAHVDHMFRGQESFEDYLFVKQVCDEMHLTFEGARLDVPEYIEKTGKSSQIAAREIRYRFFEEVMKKHNIHKLVTGHHGDDQIETVLMRLTRGATGEARAGIAYQRKFDTYVVIRPFLWSSRADIDAYCQHNCLKPRIDYSNEKPVYARNRFRLNVLPFLKKENQNTHEHFQRFSEELLEDESFLRSLAKERLESFWIKDEKFSKIQISAFLEVSKPLQRRAIQLILNYLYFERHEELSAAHLEAVLRLIQNSHSSGEIHLPAGLKVKKSYDYCTFLFDEKVQEPYSFTLHIPGDTLLPNGGKIRAYYIEGNDDVSNNTFIINPEEVRLPLTVRTRKNGDRIRIKGLNGSRKVKDIFIDEKIPLTERASWPIVEDGNRDIIWIPGLKKSNKEAVGVNKSFITLKYV